MIKKAIIKPVLFAAIVIAAASCSIDETRTADEEHIVDLAYSKDYTYPLDFYQEASDTGSVYYENTVSIKPIDQRQDIWIELSTNDMNEARIWSDKSDEYSSDHREVVSENETVKFYEFKRKNATYSKDILLSRVHKSSYFQPVQNKFSVTDTTIGKYNGDLNLTSVKELVEYLWTCGTIDVLYSKVIESDIKEYNEYFEYYIQSILIVYGDFGLHDEISVYDNFIRLNKSDRELSIKSKKVKTISRD